MKNDQYFNLEVNMLSDDRMKQLLEEMGPKGLGIYLYLLVELRKQEKYKFKPVALRELARLCQVKIADIEKVVYAYDLFKFSGTGDRARIFSPYLNRVMRNLDEKRKRLAKAGKKGEAAVKRADNGKFMGHAGAEEKSREEKSKEEKNRVSSTTTVAETDRRKQVSGSSSSDNIHDILGDIIKDTTWMELLAQQSGMGKLFEKYQEDIMAAFFKHIRLHGTGSKIKSARHIKSYLTHFLRPGTVTHERIHLMLKQKEATSKQTSEYQHETIDPDTGERSYYGRPIPADAPPRPHHRATWSKEWKKWI